MSALLLLGLRHRDPGYLYSLHYRPHNGETTGFGSKGINLVGALSDVAKEAFNGIRGPDIPMHQPFGKS